MGNLNYQPHIDGGAVARSAPYPSGVTPINNIPQDSQWRVFRWPNSNDEYYVPFGFRYPRKCNVVTLYMLNKFGNLDLSVRPYKLLRLNIDIDSRDNTVFCKARGVLKKINEIIENKALLLPQQSVENLSRLECQDVVSAAFQILAREVYNDAPPMVHQLSYVTIYDRIKEVSRRHMIVETNV